MNVNSDRGKKRQNCRWCGKLFWPMGHERSCYVCRDIPPMDRDKIVYVKEEEPKEDAKETLTQMQREAEAHGMSYGNYLANANGTREREAEEIRAKIRTLGVKA